MYNQSTEFTVNSTSVIKVLRDSLSKDKLWVRRSPSDMFLAVWVWRSQTPPICDAIGGLWCQSIHAGSSWFIFLNPCYNSSLVATNFALSDQMDTTSPLFAINLLSASMKELVSKTFVTSICMTRQEKDVNNAPYLFSCDLLSLTR